jgi:uncharacterized membrane protein YiaA
MSTAPRRQGIMIYLLTPVAVVAASIFLAIIVLYAIADLLAIYGTVKVNKSVVF